MKSIDDMLRDAYQELQDQVDAKLRDDEHQPIDVIAWAMARDNFKARIARHDFVATQENIDALKAELSAEAERVIKLNRDVLNPTNPDYDQNMLDFGKAYFSDIYRA